MFREEVLERLDALDEEARFLFPELDRIQVILAGGGALVLMQYLARSTSDIDVLSASHQFEELMNWYDLNTRIAAYIDSFPYNYEDRIQKIAVGGRIIDYYTASLEDIVIAKLCSAREKDYNDIISPNVLMNIDWEVLRRLATSEDEAAASALNAYRYREFLERFEEYERRFRPCDN